MARIEQAETVTDKVRPSAGCARAERPAAQERWTRLRCSRCRYVSEHPGPVTVGDLDGECGLCGAMLGAVTVYRVSETVVAQSPND